MIVLFAVVVALLSWWGTALVRRYALARSLLDHPNERSSHTRPTPRGGGAAIVFAIFVGLLTGYGCGWLSGAQLCGYLGSGLLVAGVGGLDDHGHVAARWRLSGHFVAAAWMLYWLGGPPTIELDGAGLTLAWWAWPICLVGMVWLLNLYNFMDGIDGLAGTQAVSVCAVACALYTVTGHSASLLVPLCVAAAASGFLGWNWPPARIFMGDVGSGFLGLMISGMALEAAHQNPEYLWAWAILMAVFVSDATFTLITRLLKGRRVYEAHRTHAYQHAAIAWGSHLKVVVVVLILNLTLLPLSLYLGLSRIGMGWALVMSYLPVIFLVWQSKAGRE